MRAEMETIWSGIHDVWADNLEQAFRDIRVIVKKFPYIGFDTEFPGVVAMPIGEFRSMGEYQYQILRCNVDLLKMIQLGLTFFDDRGHPKATYQFNFRFNIKEDMFAQDSIDLLVSSGLAFERHAEEGIDPFEFAQLLITSGVVLCEGVHWLCFHAGYDFGYLLKLLTEEHIPENETQFFERLKIYFPTIYDIKYLMKSCKSLKGGLQEVADQLQINRIGPQHTAGSDSLLTGAAFFKMREEGWVSDELLVRARGRIVPKECDKMRKFKVIDVKEDSTLKIEFVDYCQDMRCSLRITLMLQNILAICSQSDLQAIIHHRPQLSMLRRMTNNDEAREQERHRDSPPLFETERRRGQCNVSLQIHSHAIGFYTGRMESSTLVNLSDKAARTT